MGKYVEMANKVLAGMKNSRIDTTSPYERNEIDEKRVHGIPLAELREMLGSNWAECERDPELLATYAHSIQVRRMREAGEIPPHYTSCAFCTGCNQMVPIFEGSPARVLGCPWCFNRLAGRPGAAQRAVE